MLWTPGNIKEALKRLPSDTDLPYDDPLRNLVHCKKFLERVYKDPSSPLIDRIIRLDWDTLKLMEQTSFRRDLKNPLIFSWTYIPNSSEWAKFFNESEDDEDCYSSWEIYKANPPSSPISSIFIQRTWDFKTPPSKENTDIFLATVSGPEIIELIDGLSRNDKLIKGDISSFIEEYIE